MNKCNTCGKDFESKRVDARYCSATCRVKASRLGSVDPLSVTNPELNVTDVTDNQEPVLQIMVDEAIPDEYDVFVFTVVGKPSNVRHAKYWYDVPLAALPVLRDGWPEMPDCMHGRQYFLWWKNGFKLEGINPVILNPHKVIGSISIDTRLKQ